MLHDIDDNGTIKWHCPNPECAYHNCGNWDQGVTCEVHKQTQRQQADGLTLSAHISDPHLIWIDPRHICLPVCARCTRRVGINIYSEDEIAQPIIKKDELTGKILQATMPPGYEHHGNLWIKNADIIRKQQPHPTLAHLSPAQIQQMQADIRNKAPEAPIDWMLTETIEEDIHAVFPHPALARHRVLKRQLIAIGKMPPS